MRPFFLFVLAGVLFLTGCQTATTIVNDVSERDANEIIVLLASNGINAAKVAVPKSTTGGASTEQRWDISVPSPEITRSISLLNQAGFPRAKGTTLLDLFGTSGLVPSDLQDKIRYQEGLSEQLATTIRKMDGIIDADVQITFPQGDDENKIPLTASVYIKHRGILDNPNSLLVTKIKRLVSSSLPGLAIDNVTVVADRALYTDLSANAASCEEVQSYVSIWGIKVAHDSATLFRAIFYIFLILLFVFVAATLWLGWKFYPLIQAKGYRSLFNPEPYPVETSVLPPPSSPPSEGDLL